MQLLTPVALPQRAPRLEVSSRVVLLGSCFAQGVGERLSAALPAGQVAVNPFGVLYNPLSIAAALGQLLSAEPFPAALLGEGSDGVVHSWLHSGTFSRPTAREVLSAIGERLEPARRLLRGDGLLCLTFGTARLFRHRATGQVVANCHKAPAADFTVEELTPEAFVAAWQPLLQTLWRTSPGAEVVMTVSPHRYAAYGFHESTLSKARLLLGIEALQRAEPRVHYFPAYEIVLDELRDYRYYAADMLHPSPQAADYVFERFASWAFTPRLTDYARARAALLRDYAHRPLHAAAPAAQRFLAQREARRAAFEAEWGTPLFAAEGDTP